MKSWSAEQWVTFFGALGLFSSVVIAAITTAAVKIIGALQNVETKVNQLEVKVDGRLSQLLAARTIADTATGREQGRGEMIVQVPLPLPVVLIDPPSEK